MQKILRFPILFPIWVGDKKAKIRIIIVTGAVQGGYKTCRGSSKEKGVPRDSNVVMSSKRTNDSEDSPNCVFIIS